MRRATVRRIGRGGVVAWLALAAWSSVLARDELLTKPPVPWSETIGAAWRWREIDRAGPTQFVSAYGAPSGDLYVVDSGGLFRYDGRTWHGAPGWELLADMAVSAAVETSEGLLVARDDGLFAIPADERAVRQRPPDLFAYRLGEAPSEPNTIRKPWVTPDGRILTVLGEDIVEATPGGIRRRVTPPRAAGHLSIVAEDAEGRLLCGGEGGLFLQHGATWTALAVRSHFPMPPNGHGVEQGGADPRIAADPGAFADPGALAEPRADADPGAFAESRAGAEPRTNAGPRAGDALLAGDGITVGKLALALGGRDGTLMFVHDAFDGRHGVLAWDGTRLSQRPPPPAAGFVIDGASLADGSVVVALGRGELLHLDGETWQTGRAPPHVQQTLAFLAAARDGRLAFVDRSGLLRACDLDTQRWRVHDPTAPRPGRTPAMASPTVTALAASRAGGLWVGTDHGIARWDGRAFTDVQRVAGDTGLVLRGVTSVLEDDGGHLWVGSGGTWRGVLKFDGADWVHHRDATVLGEAHVHRILRAPDGSLWFLLLSGDPSDWRRGGIARWDGATWSRIDEPGSAFDRTYDVVFTPDGTPIVATRSRVLRRDGDTWTHLGAAESDDRGAFALHLSRDGRLHRGLGVGVRGVASYDETTDTWPRRTDGPWGQVAAGDFAEDDAGRLWCASFLGLFVIEGSTCRRIPTDGVVTVPAFWPLLAADGGRTLWIGSVGDGLLAWSPDDMAGPVTESIHRLLPATAADVVALSWRGADAWHETPRAELRYRVRVDDGPWSEPAAESSREWALSEGPHRIEVVTIDDVGRTSPPLGLAVTTDVPFRRQPAAWGLAVLVLGCLGTLAFVLVRRQRERREAARVEADLTQRLRRLARHLMDDFEEERRSLSKDLTDDLGQVLTAASLHLDRVRLGPPTESREALREAHAALQHALERVRGLATGVRPSMLDDLGVDVAVRALLDSWQEEAGIRVDVEIDLGALTVSERATNHVYRILQECLANVRRHAVARRVDVRLFAAEGALRLDVTDDGVGFLPHPRQPTTGHGLLAARERAAASGGTLRIESSPGHGTAIRVSIPVHP